MTIVAHELKASYAFIERNFFLTRRYWGWELAFLVYSVAGALSISLIGADQGSEELRPAQDRRHERVLQAAFPALHRDGVGEPAEDHAQVDPEDGPDHQRQ